MLCAGESGVEDCGLLVCKEATVRPGFGVPCVPQVKKKNMAVEVGMRCLVASYRCDATVVAGSSAGVVMSVEVQVE